MNGISCQTIPGSRYRAPRRRKRATASTSKWRVRQAASSAAILVSNFAASGLDFDLSVTNLPWAGQTVVETRRVNASESLDLVTRQTNDASSFSISIELKKPAVALIRLRPLGR